MTRTTIKDIARKANVSIATVSRVINGKPTVAPELYDNVMAVIRETGYYPNQLARSLKATSSKTIGVIVPDITNEYIAQIITVIDSYIQPKGYTLILCSSLNDAQNELKGLRLLLEKQVDGIIINTTGFNNAYVSKLSQRIPILSLHRKIDRPDFHGDWIDTDIYECAFSLTRLLLRNGHQRIGCLSGPMHLSTARMRLDGFCAALKEAGYDFPLDSPYIYEGDFTLKSGSDGAHYFLSLPNPPTAIVNMHGESTLGMLRYFRMHDVCVPEDISLVSISAIPNSDILYVQPYHYQMRPDSIGYRAAQMLLERIESENTLQNRESCFSMPIIEGNSVRNLRESRSC